MIICPSFILALIRPALRGGLSPAAIGGAAAASMAAAIAGAAAPMAAAIAAPSPGAAAAIPSAIALAMLGASQDVIHPCCCQAVSQVFNMNKEVLDLTSFFSHETEKLACRLLQDNPNRIRVESPKKFQVLLERNL